MEAVPTSTYTRLVWEQFAARRLSQLAWLLVAPSQQHCLTTHLLPQDTAPSISSLTGRPEWDTIYRMTHFEKCERLKSFKGFEFRWTMPIMILFILINIIVVIMSTIKTDNDNAHLNTLLLERHSGEPVVQIPNQLAWNWFHIIYSLVVANLVVVIKSWDTQSHIRKWIIVITRCKGSSFSTQI